MRFKLASMLVVGVLLGAAGPEGMQIQITDVGPLAQSAASPAPRRALTFQNTMYQAAPVPDVDAAPPNAAIRTEAQIAPKLLSPQSLFQGDGFSRGSSQEASLESRKSGRGRVGIERSRQLILVRLEFDRHSRAALAAWRLRAVGHAPAAWLWFASPRLAMTTFVSQRQHGLV